ncbi:MAG: flagellar basal body-associated FliL family protein [Pararhodobacter sp.]|nr:flagellar basal body-associated FliL family protein [Pararhodobacter sp.]
MTDATDAAEAPAKTRNKALPLGLAAALVLGGGGFYATYSGLIGAPAASPPPAQGHTAEARFAYLPLDPIIVNIGLRDQARLLRFSAELEVAPDHLAEVSRLRPRILDVLNTYLRALEMHELEEPAAMIRLRSQMLRRVQIVTGAGRVNDLLVIEFVFN